MMGYASERFRTTVYFGCETVSGVWPRSMRSHRHAETLHQRNKVITCQKFNSSDGTFTPSFEATVVNRYMNRALVGLGHVLFLLSLVTKPSLFGSLALTSLITVCVPSTAHKRLSLSTLFLWKLFRMGLRLNLTRRMA